MPDGPGLEAKAAVRADCVVGAAVARIAEALVKKNVLAIVAGDYRARDIFAALQGAAPDVQVLFFPSSDALPGDSQPPTPANTGARMAALRRARLLAGPRSKTRIACITTAEAASELLPDPKAFDGPLSKYVVGRKFDQDGPAFAATLRNMGYFEDDRVDEPAEFAIRGKVIDIFPADAARPVRIELNEGVISRIREFDVVSQRGLGDLQTLELGSAAVPFFPGKGHSLLDYFPGALIALDPGAAGERARFLALAADAATSPAGKSGAASKKLVSQSAWDAGLKERKLVDLKAAPGEEGVRFGRQRDPVKAMNAAIVTAMKEKARIVVAGTAHDLGFIKKRLAKKVAKGARPIPNWLEADKGWLNRVKLLEMRLDQGWRDPKMLVIAASDVLGANAGIAAASAEGAEHALEIGDVCVGDVVIHEDHGLAVISGLRLPSGAGAGAVGEAIELEYAAGAKRLVPVEEADRIWRYGADRTAVTLDGLDGASWRKRRLIIDRAMTETAAELTRLSKENAKRRAAKIEAEPDGYQIVVDGFPFSETPDQARAIAAVQEDLASGRPMDRLVIGDVGYGKTEVAIRAAAMVALSGKQVVMAAPTTVLVRQHYETFKRRFEKTGVKVASLSRLADTAERKRVKAGLADGSIDIVVGTGAVGKDVEYAKLGLVVVDEEQRFGAADKATLRDLGDKGHALSLTATPIPRTLQNAMLGLKQMSVIATPPARRQPIRTFTGVFDDHQVKTALLREKDRGGQSFVVVPRIQDIEAMAETLHRLAPDLDLLKAHGDMAPSDIDVSMVKFANGLADVLLATNIIEAGLDVPRANTMVIWRSDRFGLAQLHQLRGRVGRGARRGHILLTTEPGASLTEATKKRLRTLESLDRLGAGFAISARDLDIRGAGDLVGDAQSGHMKLIGIDLYQHLLERAVREAGGETIERWSPVLNLGVSGRIPESWIPEADTRLALYLRLSRLTTNDELKAFEDELVDRFGEEPAEAATLLRLARVRVLARDAEVSKVDAGPTAIAFTPRVELVKKRVAEAGLVARNNRLVLEEAIADAPGRLARIETVLLQLIGRKRA